MVPLRNKLLEHPVVAAIIVIAVYLVFLIIGEVVSLIISRRLLVDAPFLAQTARFVVLFLLNALVWFWLVPNAMLMPVGKIPFDKYVNTIRLDKTSARPYVRNILYALLCVSIICLSLLIASILTGEYIFDIS